MSRHGHDIDALYELVQGVDRKVDTLTAEFRAHAAATAAKLDEILLRAARSTSVIRTP